MNKFYQTLKNYVAKPFLVGGLSLLVSIGCDNSSNYETKFTNTSPQESKSSEITNYKFKRVMIDRIKEYSDDPEGVSCGDFDGDGDIDIIVASSKYIVIYDNETPQKKK